MLQCNNGLALEASGWSRNPPTQFYHSIIHPISCYFYACFLCESIFIVGFSIMEAWHCVNKCKCNLTNIHSDDGIDQIDCKPESVLRTLCGDGEASFS